MGLSFEAIVFEGSASNKAKVGVYKNLPEITLPENGGLLEQKSVLFYVFFRDQDVHIKERLLAFFLKIRRRTCVP